jgi:nonspecific dipeptidase
MTDLIALMGTLTNTKGEILVDGVHKDVAAVTEKEEESYKDIDFDLDEYMSDCGVTEVSGKMMHDNKKDLLMHRWRFPTLSLHGIEGAFSGTGAKTVIPRKVMGKFSLRLVPDQDPKDIARCVTEHLDKEFAKLGSPNKMWVKAHHGAKSWLSSFDHPNYVAAANAVEKVYGDKPDMTREGGT